MADGAQGGEEEGEARVPVVATELCRERITGLPCDRRRPRSVLHKEFPHVDFSLIKEDEDELPQRVLEDAELCKRRATRFLQWICSRPEQRIAVVSHSGFLTHLFSQFGMNRSRPAPRGPAPTRPARRARAADARGRRR